MFLRLWLDGVGIELNFVTVSRLQVAVFELATMVEPFSTLLGRSGRKNSKAMSRTAVTVRSVLYLRTSRFKSVQNNDGRGYRQSKEPSCAADTRNRPRCERSQRLRVSSCYHGHAAAPLHKQEKKVTQGSVYIREFGDGPRRHTSGFSCPLDHLRHFVALLAGGFQLEELSNLANQGVTAL